MREYLIPQILPAYEVHLLAGPSGAGKTTLLFQWIKSIKANEPILNFPTTNLEIAYVAYDRSELSIAETMDRVGITNQHMTWKSLRNQFLPPYKVPSLFPDANLIIMDAIGDLPTMDSNKGSEVAYFLSQLGNCAIQNHITFLGILHCAKTKQNERYLNPRQRISGSKAWASFSDTVFLLEPLDPENPEIRKRELFVLPRNSAEFKIELDVTSNGTLEVSLDSILSDSEQQILMILAKQPLIASQLEEKCVIFSISRATFYRCLKHLQEIKKIAKVGDFYCLIP